jgi:AcrR family transcriptional regulator
MVPVTQKPTRRDERRLQTVQEIKSLAMEQIRQGGPDAVSLSGIAGRMSMSPAAIYRYFENRDALLADLVVDAYDDFAHSLATVAAQDGGSPEERLLAVLSASRTWALAHPNAYRLIFQTSLGSGKEFAVERTVSAATQSMAVVVAALAAVFEAGVEASAAPVTAGAAAELDRAIRVWSEGPGFADVPPVVLTAAVMSWTRLHGIISLELGGHLDAAGLDAGLLYGAEIAAIRTLLGR